MFKKKTVEIPIIQVKLQNELEVNVEFESREERNKAFEEAYEVLELNPAFVAVGNSIFPTHLIITLTSGLCIDKVISRELDIDCVPEKFKEEYITKSDLKISTNDIYFAEKE